MFEYILPDGTALPENEVIKLAVQKGLTPDDYVKKNKLTLRPKQKKAEVKKEVAKPVTVEKPVVEKPVVEKAKPVVKEKEPVVSAFPETPGLDILGVKKMASAKPAVKPVESIKPKQKLISIEEAKKQQEDIDTANKAKNVDFLDSLKANFDTGLLTAFQGVQDLPVNATEWAVSLTNPILNALGQEELAVDNIVKAFKLENPDAKDLSKRIKKANTILQAFNDKNGGDPLAAIQNKNYLGAAKMVAGGTVQALPLMGAALLGGGATGAAAVIAGLSTSMKQTRLREEQPEMELANRVTNAGVTGIMEGFLGQMFAGASGAAVKRIIGETGIKVGSKTVSRGIVNSLSTAVEKSPFIGLLGEVAEESTVELGEQLTDMASGIRKELDIKAITNSGIIATGMGGINTTSVYGAKGYMKANEYSQVKKINKEVNNLSQQLSNPLIPDDNKAIISSRIDRLVSENRALVGNSLEKVDALPTTVKTELNDINTTIDDLSVKFDNLQDDTTLTPEVKLAMAKEIRFNAQELQNRKFKIIEGNYINDDFNKLPEDKRNAFKEEAVKALEQEAVTAGKEIVTFKPEDINAKALNLYTMDARSTALAKDIEGVKTGIEKLGLGEEVEIQPLEDETDIMNYLGENTDLNIDEIKRYSNNYGVFVPLDNGKEALIINKRLAKEQGVVTTGAHEFLHKLVYKAVKTNPELQKKVGTLLYDHIESYVGKEGFADTKFKERYDDYKTDFEASKKQIDNKIKLADNYLSKGQITQEQYNKVLLDADNAKAKFEGKYLEETLPLLSESLTNGDIKYNETFFTRMGDIIRRVFQNFGLSKVNFETGKDVFDFVRDYNKSFEKGQYTKAFSKLAKEGEYKGAKPTVTGIEGPMVSNIKESRAQIDSLKEELSTLEDEYDEGYGNIEEQDYKVQKSNIERKIQIEQKKLESNVVKPQEKNITVYHGAPIGKDVTKISDKGVKFFATDKREANEYARINSGVTQEFLLNDSQIVNEDVAINKMKELRLTPKNKEFEVDDASFYELIDTRFEESLSKEDIVKLFDALKKDGVKALSYNDGAQVTGRSTTSIAVIDPSIISKPKKEVEKISNTEEDEVKEIIKAERGSISSDKVQQLYESKGREAADEIIRLFKPITKKIVDKRRDAPDFDRELLTDEIETGVGGILDLITKYKPESGVPLAAYINKYLPMRAIATSKRILGKEFTKDVTEEVGLATEETVTEAKEKPKYKNVLESKVFEPGELETINNKVLTVIRTLKSRIDAPVSLNRTVTPLIAEIRDEIGKQIDIDVKTAMGGKKDGQLRKWMTNNKKYILENMTTTWLMGKDGQGGMPIAIQKSIDNKWTNFPEWVGKKVDRESVSTDLAGRTSGAELVRRLPNVNNNITNEEFLAQVIGPDGNPLRGRKESLAKAIAEEATFDIINDDLSNEGPIFDAFATNQQRLGVELIDNLAIEIAKQSERGNVKFSMKPNEIKDKTTKLVKAASEFGVGSAEYIKVLKSIPKNDRSSFEQKVIYDNPDFITNLQEMQSSVSIGDDDLDKPKTKSVGIGKEFNKILEENVGVKVEEEFSDIVAKRTGAAIGKYRFFVPPSAADLELLIYDFLGYGKAGEKQQKFFNKVLFEPYAEGIAKIDAAKQSIKTDYKALLKSYPKVSKELGKLTPDGNFTYDQALRVSMWAKAGIDVPGLLKEDVTKLNDFVNKNAELSAFRDGLIATGRQEKGWVEPSEYWDSETIVSDLHNITEKVGRQTYLKEFKENSEEMFSKENLNKIETIYGSNFRDALEDSVYSMINGTNREGGAGRINAAWLNWINNSTGAIMFWNTRSAVLQTIGAINYLNWRDNNPLNAAKAFANQPQYWKDFAYIWNSDKMKERRSGLKEDVSSAEIANAAAGTTSKANAVISYLLKKGFLPTQIGDSFAIASGGAAFYRNRINYNLKQGMSEVGAEEAAWKEFLKVTDQTQQSGDPRDVSQQQRSAAGRLVLAFQNTSMQQARLVKKAGLDLINNRGDAKTNISKIVYYTAVQNIIFGSLQSALFATIFSSDSDEEKEKKKQTLEDKWLNIGNNIVDTILRGSGMAGAVVATLKNVYLKYNDENKKGFKAEYAKVLTEAANIAPPLGSKFTKMMGAMNTREFEKDVIAKRGWDVAQNGRLSLSPSYSVLGKTAEAATNLPLDRFVTKVNNLSEALDSRNKSWQRIALAIGYSPYVVGVKNEEADIIKAEAKEERKIAGKEKAAETRKINKEKLRNMPSEERRALREKKREEKRKLREKKRNTYK